MIKKSTRICVTGLPIGGKTNLANKLQKDLSGFGKVINHDVDYTSDWKDYYLGRNEEFYILQTPHGAEAEIEDGVFFNDFGVIASSIPETSCYLRLLVNRGFAWFKEGVEKYPCNKKPTPFSPKLINPIIRNIVYCYENQKRWIKEDREGFRERGIDLIEIIPYFRNSKLSFENYSKLLLEIFKKWN